MTRREAIETITYIINSGIIESDLEMDLEEIIVAIENDSFDEE